MGLGNRVNEIQKEDSSFSEEKEAKRLLYVWVWGTRQHRTPRQTYQKSFASFLQKRRVFPFLLLPDCPAS